MRIKILLLSAVTVCASLLAKANTGTGTGEESAKKSDLLGGVYNSETKKPLGNVVVTAYVSNKKEKSVVTDSNGNFSFDELKPGTYKIVFEKDGYKKVTKEKKIFRIDEGLQINVSLEEHHNYDFTPGPSLFFDSK